MQHKIERKAISLTKMPLKISPHKNRNANYYLGISIKMKIRSTSSKTLFGYPYCNKKRVFNKKQKL
jgi:hypothetical protein